MKKTFLLMAVALVAMLGISSCSDDENRASVLSGEWEGNWNMWYQDETGRTWRSSNTYLRFDRSHSRSGTGTQVDYYRYGPYEYLTYRFRWTVNNGVIYLTYPYDPDLNVDIYDYHLGDLYFDGYLGDTSSRFTMDRISHFDYWEPGYWVDDWYGYTIYDDYYSNSYHGGVASKSFTKGKLPKIVKRGGHTVQPTE